MQIDEPEFESSFPQIIRLLFTKNRGYRAKLEN